MAEQSNLKFLIFFLAFFLSGALVAQTSKKNSVQASFSFEYKNFPLKVETYNVKPGSRYDIAETRNVKDMSKAPVTNMFKGKLSLERGSKESFALVIKNQSDKDQYFFASPHLIDPIESTRGQHFECLCNHHLFRVKKKSVWYRIVAYEIAADYSFANVDLKHTIIGIPESEAKKKYKDAVYK